MFCVNALRRTAIKRQLAAALVCSRNTSSSTTPSLADILASVQSGTLMAEDAEKMILAKPPKTPEETLQYFANLDHTRSSRSGFPEVVFAENKTPKQVAMIMDDMARHINENGTNPDFKASTVILATRYVQ
jgi:pyridinium-3,5-biscarboxylic acid mononucleotide synthase